MFFSEARQNMIRLKVRCFKDGWIKVLSGVSLSFGGLSWIPVFDWEICRVEKNKPSLSERKHSNRVTDQPLGFRAAFHEDCWAWPTFYLSFEITRGPLEGNLAPRIHIPDTKVHAHINLNVNSIRNDGWREKNNKRYSNSIWNNNHVKNEDFIGQNHVLYYFH